MCQDNVKLGQNNCLNELGNCWLFTSLCLCNTWFFGSLVCEHPSDYEGSPLCTSAGSPTGEMEGSVILSLSVPRNKRGAWTIRWFPLESWETWAQDRGDGCHVSRGGAWVQGGLPGASAGRRLTRAVTGLTMAGPGCASCYQGFLILAGFPFSPRNLWAA